MTHGNPRTPVIIFTALRGTSHWHTELVSTVQSASYWCGYFRNSNVACQEEVVFICLKVVLNPASVFWLKQRPCFWDSFGPRTLSWFCIITYSAMVLYVDRGLRSNQKAVFATSLYDFRVFLMRKYVYVRSTALSTRVLGLLHWDMYYITCVRVSLLQGFCWGCVCPCLGW